jgi:hypothetical protein
VAVVGLEQRKIFSYVIFLLKFKTTTQMKKTTLIALFAISCVCANAQTKKLKEYKASNGVYYKLGDTIKLAKGSSENGNFEFLTISGLAALYANDGSAPSLNKTYQYANMNVILKKIYDVKKGANEKIIFYVDLGNTYSLDIENAIQYKEIK